MKPVDGRRSAGALSLLPAQDLVCTGPVDHADWNYRPLLGAVQRLRFRIVRALLPSERCHRLLEIGYGSGVFMPELAKHADELYGIDPHPKSAEVQQVLARHDIRAYLTSGSAESLPYEDGFVGVAVSVSAMEYVEDIERACRELRRVLRPNGVLIVCTPGTSPLWDIALKLSTGQNPAQYADRRQKLIPTLSKHFRVARQIAVPRWGGRILRLYTGLRLIRAPD